MASFLMSLKNQIEEQFHKALKEKDKAKVSTLRLILAAIKEKDIASRSQKNKEPIKDSDISQVLKKMLKQRKESIEIYKKGNREDLLKVEALEVKIIEEFLPKQIGEEETKKICEDIVKKLNVGSIKEMGKVMGELKKTHADTLDFSKVGSILREIIK